MTTLKDFEFSLKGKPYYPLLVGGMGVNISTAELALSAARAGAIGHISDAMSPFVSDKRYGTHFQNTKFEKYRDFRDSEDKSQVKWAADVVYRANRICAERVMAAKVGTGAVFINVMEKLTMGAPKETLKARLEGALDGGVDGITLSAGLHTGTLRLIEDHPRFHDANIGIIVSSARALHVFLRSAKRSERLPDYVIVEGPLAGGHLGFGPDWREHNLLTIVQEVIQLLRDEDLYDKIAVIPAGGVFTGTDAVDMLDMGAHAVQVATRFTISRECGLPTAVKQKYLRANEEDVEVNFTSPTGYPMRMLKSSPSLRSNVHPNCEALGYILDGDGKCAYHQAYKETPVNEKGEKLPVASKMCICYQFMKYACYTCGHNVYRLKEATHRINGNEFYLPPAADIIYDYLHSTGGEIILPRSYQPETTELQQCAL